MQQVRREASRPRFFWEASGSARQRSAASMRRRAGRETGAAKFTCQPRQIAVISNLPIKRLTRATRKGQSKLAASKETEPGRLIDGNLRAARVS